MTFRAGFVLPVAVIMVAVAAIIVAAVGGYVSNVSRQTRIYIAKDRCRFAAQSAIEQAKCEVQEGFLKYISSNFASIQIAPGKAKAYNWFNTVSGDRRTIGSATPVTIFSGKTYPLVENGCKVWCGIGRYVDHPLDSSRAVIPIVATAEYTYADGLKVTATVQERLVFGTGQSKVFDNAYFVNNYGWMNGGFVINGEFRANGNVSLKGGCTVNGLVSAAPNSEIGAAGTVTIGSASIKNRANYRSSVGTRARYDTGNLDDVGVYDPAKTSGTIVKPTYNSDGSVRSGTLTEKNATVVNEKVDPVDMPFVSELGPYIDFAREEGGTLYHPSVTYTDTLRTKHTISAGTVRGYHSLSDEGPSGNAAIADAGSLLLVGTQSNPIVIDGPVVVAGDVIIKGYVKGQGTIYAGRNIHVIGSIKYVNAPSWTHTKTGSAATAEQTANESKDMLGLIAKGNIVIGDSTSSSIASGVNSGDDIAYYCDENDSAIGYPSQSYPSTSSSSSGKFAGDYTATEKIRSLSSSLASSAPGGYNSSSGQFGKVRKTTETYYENKKTGRKWEWTGPLSGKWVDVYEQVANTKTVMGTSYDRRYYETICDDAIISSMKETVSQIDAVMYNNHGVFGSLGSSFQINGALICRDEGLRANGGSFNWDMRLRRKKDSQVVDKLGLPVGTGDTYILDWIELPAELNPCYPSGGESSK